MTITIILIVLTILFSIRAFANRPLFDKYRFNAYYIHHEKQWFRFFSYGFLHVDWVHLFVNIFVLFSFGRVVEEFFTLHFQAAGLFLYLLFYLLSLPASVIFSYIKHKGNIDYNAVGASGAVSAIVFASILFYPAGKIFLLILPVPMPAWVFGILYLVYSAYMAKKAADNVGHDAHFWGAVFGFLFPIILKPGIVLLFFRSIF